MLHIGEYMKNFKWFLLFLTIILTTVFVGCQNTSEEEEAKAPMPQGNLFAQDLDNFGYAILAGRSIKGTSDAAATITGTVMTKEKLIAISGSSLTISGSTLVFPDPMPNDFSKAKSIITGSVNNYFVFTGTSIVASWSNNKLVLTGSPNEDFIGKTIITGSNAADDILFSTNTSVEGRIATSDVYFIIVNGTGNKPASEKKKINITGLTNSVIVTGTIDGNATAETITDAIYIKLKADPVINTANGWVTGTSDSTTITLTGTGTYKGVKPLKNITVRPSNT
jgi:hypothetical protein